MKKAFEIYDELSGQRLDKAIGKAPVDITRSKAEKLIAAGCVKVNGSVVEQPKVKVNVGDIIEIEDTEKELRLPEAENIPIDIVYEDEHIAVINKPAGMLVHPAQDEFTGTLVNALLYKYGNILPGSDPIRPGIVHRLDRDTSGLMVIAKSERAFVDLSEQMKHRKTIRKYMALVCGKIKDEYGIIDVPIGRDPKRRSFRKAEGVAAREAITKYRVLERFQRYTLIEADLVTGRTHQIRVHFSYKGYPVTGDPIYKRTEDDLYIFDSAKNKTRAEHQLLQSVEIGFRHPESGKFVTFRTEPDEEITKAINLLVV